jgi:hypothetical protein
MIGPAKRYTSEELRDILNRWYARDAHQDKADEYQADFINSVADYGIAARNQGRLSPMRQMLVPPFQRVIDVRFSTNRVGIIRDRSKKAKTIG